MPPTLIATPGAANANSYATVAEANAYHDCRLHSDAWLNTRATASIGSGDDGVVEITAVERGAVGNGYTVAVVLAGSANAPLSVSLVGSALTVTLGTTGAGAADDAKNTATLIAQAINELMEFIAIASGSGDAHLAVSTVKSFRGGDDREDVKIPALLMATQLIDAHIKWEGWPVTEQQRLCWPRAGMVTRNGYAIADNAIPQELKDMTSELARQLLSEDRTADGEVETQGLRSLRAGPVDMTFRDNVAPKVIPDAVVNLMPKCWGVLRSTKSFVVELVRG